MKKDNLKVKTKKS